MLEYAHVKAGSPKHQNDAIGRDGFQRQPGCDGITFMRDSSIDHDHARGGSLGIDMPGDIDGRQCLLGAFR